MTEIPDLPPMPLRPARERLVGALILFTLTGTFAHLTVHGRLQELQDHLTVTVPLGGILALSGTALLLPIPIVAEAMGLSKHNGEKVKRGRSYAAIIETNGDLLLAPIKGPAVATKQPPALYEPKLSARVRVPKTIRAGSYLTIFNHGNPQPVNEQGIKGFTAEHAHNLVGGILSSTVNGAWANSLGLSLNRRRLILMLAAGVLLYLLYQWYRGRYG